jgi:predicted RNA-binding protein YlqC (UPF0109 family)
MGGSWGGLPITGDRANHLRARSSWVEVSMLRELVDYMAKALVDHPEQVQVSELEGEQTSVIELRVAKEDLGKVIGKQGRTARAMRTILSAASTKIRKRAVLEIIE